MVKLIFSTLFVIFSASILVGQNVGIGTFYPQANLHLFNANNTTVIAETDGNSKYAGFEAKTNAGLLDKLYFRKWSRGTFGTIAGIDLDNLSMVGTDVQAGGLLLGVANNNPLYFTTNNIVHMRIDGDGKIGVGVKVPSSKVDISTDERIGLNVVTTSSEPFTQAIVGYTRANNGVAITGISGLTFYGYGPAKFGVVGSSDNTGTGVGGFGNVGVFGISSSVGGAGIIAQHEIGKTAL